MSGSSVCLTFNIIQAIKLPLPGLPICSFFLGVGELFEHVLIYCFSAFFLLPFPCRVAQKKKFLLKKTALSSCFPCLGINILSAGEDTGGWFLVWLKYKMLLLLPFSWEGEILGWASLSPLLHKFLQKAPATGSAPVSVSQQLASTTTELRWWEQCLALCVPANYQYE